MEAKISKTVRLSAEVIAMIEAQAGENFTAKFEALVTRCMWELPKKEQELAGIQERTMVTSFLANPRTICSR